MRRCFRLGQLGRDAQPSLVDAQIADLSHEEPWVEHVRGYEENIAGGLARDFIAGARLGVGGTAGHEDDNALSGLYRT